MKNEYIVDWSALKSWTIESQFSGIRLVFFVFWCVLLAASVVFGIYSQTFLFVFMAVYCFYRAFVRNTLIAKQQYKRLAQIYGKTSWVRTISFEEKEIVIKEEKSEIKNNYSDIVEIVEKGEKIYLKLKAKTTIRLFKSKFIDCSWEDCKKRIEENNNM